MRSVVAFYRARPLVGILALVVGLAVAVGTELLGSDDGVVLPIAFTAVVGLVVGGVVAMTQRRGRR
jgi:hypothetical protein